MEKFIHIETYGCSANQNNSEIMAGLLKQGGYEITNNEKIADILIINTCIVKGKTESKIKRRIQDLSNLYKNKLIIISGCMPQTDSNSLKKINPNLLLLGIHHIQDIIKLIRDFNGNRLTKQREKEYIESFEKPQSSKLSKKDFDAISFGNIGYSKSSIIKKNKEKLCIPKISLNKLISITQISEGCLGKCSFCKVKLAKGTLFSYPENKILKSIENDLNSGAKEIWLTSQDNASYGLDRNKQDLPELLKKILSLRHNFKLRLGMMNPNNLYPIVNEIIEIYKNKKMYKFLHIPIQSASDKILEDMNRSYKIEIAEEIMNKFEKMFLDITIATDIITGYPTETEQEHKLNIEFLKKYKPDVLNLSKFSSHENTEAEKLIPLEKELINKRASELMQLHRKTAMKNKQKFKDRIVNVFVNNKTKIPDVQEARDENYNIILINSKDKSILGKNLYVKIKQKGVHHMIAEMEEKK